MHHLVDSMLKYLVSYFMATDSCARYQGLTRNASPLYLVYPPDPSGRRPNEYTQLQFASPAQREAYERSEAARLPLAGPIQWPNEQPHHAGLAMTNHTAPQWMMGAGTMTAGTARPTVISGGGDYTSSEGSNGPRSRPPTQPTRTRYWYCCTPGCIYPGPYIEDLYDNCIHGCGAVRCSRCRREIVSLRDRPPAHVSSSSARRL